MLKNTLKNRVRDFLFKYFLSNALLTVFMQNALSKRRIIEIKNELLIVRKKTGTLLFSILLEICVQSLKSIV